MNRHLSMEFWLVFSYIKTIFKDNDFKKKNKGRVESETKATQVTWTQKQTKPQWLSWKMKL